MPDYQTKKFNDLDEISPVDASQILVAKEDGTDGRADINDILLFNLQNTEAENVDFDPSESGIGQQYTNVQSALDRVASIAIAAGSGGGSGYILPTMSISTKGGATLGSYMVVSGTALSIDTAALEAALNIPPAYTLPTMSTSVKGGAEVGDYLIMDGDKVKVDLTTLTPALNIPLPYTLPIASSSILGGVKVGTGLTIDDEGILSSTGGGGPVAAVDVTYDNSVSLATATDVQGAIDELFMNGTGYTLPTMSASIKGGATVGTYMTVTDTALSIDVTTLRSDLNIPPAYVLPEASDSILGGMKVGNNLDMTDGVVSVDVPSLNIPSAYVLPQATASTMGGGKIDEVTLLNNEFMQLYVNTPSLALATDQNRGVVKIDNVTIQKNIDDQINVPIATNTSLGVVKVDNITTKIDGSGELTVPIGSPTVAGIAKFGVPGSFVHIHGPGDDSVFIIPSELTFIPSGGLISTTFQTAIVEFLNYTKRNLGPVVFVNASGTDESIRGSQCFPLRTVNYAQTIVPAGGTIIVMGTITENVIQSKDNIDIVGFSTQWSPASFIIGNITQPAGRQRLNMKDLSISGNVTISGLGNNYFQNISGGVFSFVTAAGYNELYACEPTSITVTSLTAQNAQVTITQCRNVTATNNSALGVVILEECDIVTSLTVSGAVTTLTDNKLVTASHSAGLLTIDSTSGLSLSTSAPTAAGNLIRLLSSNFIDPASTSFPYGYRTFTRTGTCPIYSDYETIWPNNTLPSGVTVFNPLPTGAQVGNIVGTALGAASAGTELTAARSDHVHPLPATATGSTNGLMSSTDKTKLDSLEIKPPTAVLSDEAIKLQTARTISLTGPITGSASFDGSANASITTTLDASGLPDATINSKGVIQVGSNLSVSSGTLSVDVASLNIPAPYTLPTSTESVLGGVKIDGTTITITDGTISSTGGYTLPIASSSVLGGVKIGGNLDMTDGVVSVDVPSLNIPSAYTLPTATDAILGGIKIGSGLTITDGVLSIDPATFSPVPIGAIFYFTSDGTPDGYVVLNGSTQLRAGLLANLWAYAQANCSPVSETDWNNGQKGKFHEGDGSTTFGVPDLRGRYVRHFGTSRIPGKTLDVGDLQNFSTEPFALVNPASNSQMLANWYVTNPSTGLNSSSLNSTSGIQVIFPNNQNWDPTDYVDNTSMLEAYPQTYDYQNPNNYERETRPDSCVLLPCIKY